MGKVQLSMTMSLDGFVAAPNGDDADLHHYLFGGTIPVTKGGYTFHLTSQRAAELFDEGISELGAVVMGRRAFDTSGQNPPFQMPTFVLTRQARQPETTDGATTTFVSNGIDRALAQAKDAAGDKDVVIFGGANIAQQYLKAGLLDEINLDLVPVLLGEGIRLFDNLGPDRIELAPTRVIETPDVTFLRFRPVPSK